MTGADEPVQRQLDAYNRRDLEAFLSCYAPDAVTVTDLGAVVLEGAAAFREKYEARFHGPDWRPAAIEGRLVAMDWVVDHEVIAHPDGTVREALVAFHVSDGLVDRVVVLRPPTSTVSARGSGDGTGTRPPPS